MTKKEDKTHEKPTDEEKQKVQEAQPDETALKENMAELTDTLKRVQADFENYKKRCDKQQQDFIKYSNSELVAKLLPVIDNFEHALKNGRNSEQKNSADFVKGIEMIYAQLMSTLKTEGLRQIDALGKHFDPYRHEALIQEASGKEPGTIIEVLQKGYTFHDKVLRHAKVKIAKKQEEEKEEEKKTDKNVDKHKDTKERDD